MEIKLLGTRAAIIEQYIPEPFKNLIRQYTRHGEWTTQIGPVTRRLTYPLAAWHALHVSFHTDHLRAEFVNASEMIRAEQAAIQAAADAALAQEKAAEDAKRAALERKQLGLSPLNRFLTPLLGEPDIQEDGRADYFLDDEWVLSADFGENGARVTLLETLQHDLRYPVIGYFTVHKVAYETVA